MSKPNEHNARKQWAGSSFDPKAAFSYKHYAFCQDDTCSIVLQHTSGQFEALEVVPSFQHTEPWPFRWAQQNAPGRIAFLPRHCTLVPESFYDPTSKKQTLAFHVSGPLEGDVHAEYLPTLSSYLLFDLPLEARAMQEGIFRSWKPGSVCSSLLEQWALLEKFRERSVAYLYFFGNRFGLACFQSGTLQFFNLFPKASPEDVAYYILFALENLQWSPQDTRMEIGFDGSEPSEALTLLRKYIREVDLQSRPVNMELAPELRDLDAHRFHTLFTQPLCA